MTEAEELELLIAQQASDDTHYARPEFRDVIRLDASTVTSDRFDTGGVLSDLIGVDDDGEVLSFLRPMKGSVLNGGAAYHGTEDGYVNHRCRCKRCRTAHTEASMRRRKERIVKGIPTDKHGTLTGYQNYDCRCDKCRKVIAEWRRKKRGPIKEQVCANPDCGKRFTPLRRSGVRFCSKRCGSTINSRERRARMRTAA